MPTGFKIASIWTLLKLSSQNADNYSPISNLSLLETNINCSPILNCQVARVNRGSHVAAAEETLQVKRTFVPFLLSKGVGGQQSTRLYARNLRTLPRTPSCPEALQHQQGVTLPLICSATALVVRILPFMLHMSYSMFLQHWALYYPCRGAQD